MSLRALLLCFVVLGSLTLGECMKCYQCNYAGIGTDNENCNFPTKGSTLSYDCNSMCATVFTGSVTTNSFSRSCMPLCVNGFTTADGGAQITTYCCTGDYCNTAAKISAFRTILTLLPFVLIAQFL